MNKKLKRKIIIIGVIILVAILAFVIQRVIFNNLLKENDNDEAEANTANTVATTNETGEEIDNTINDVDPVDDGKTLVVPAYSDKITSNSLWCGSFALVWNDLMEKEKTVEIKFNPQEKSADNLNKKEFNENSISEKDYYKTYGPTTLDTKKKIEKAIKDKFNEKSDILDKIDWSEKDDGASYIFYAMLKKIFTFEYEFEDLEKGNFEGDKYKDIAYFGVSASSREEIKDQIRVLYYNNDDDFAVELSTKEKERVIVCNNPEGKTFKEIYENLNSKSKSFTGIRILESSDEFKMPELNIDILKHFTQFEGKNYYNADNEELGMIDQAMQTIKLKLDKKGGTLKSEAAIVTKATSVERPKTPRKFYVDDSFVMFLAEEGKDVPYYASMITDITLFQK